MLSGKTGQLGKCALCASYLNEQTQNHQPLQHNRLQVSALSGPDWILRELSELLNPQMA